MNDQNNYKSREGQNKSYKKNQGKKPLKKDFVPKKPREPKLSPVEATVRDGNLEQAMRVLKNKMAKENILGEIRKRRYFEKPSEIKRRKKREALRKARPMRKKAWVKRSKVVASVPVRKFDEE